MNNLQTDNFAMSKWIQCTKDNKETHSKEVLHEVDNKEIYHLVYPLKLQLNNITRYIPKNFPFLFFSRVFDEKSSEDASNENSKKENTANLLRIKENRENIIIPNILSVQENEVVFEINAQNKDLGTYHLNALLLSKNKAGKPLLNQKWGASQREYIQKWLSLEVKEAIENDRRSIKLKELVYEEHEVPLDTTQLSPYEVDIFHLTMAHNGHKFIFKSRTTKLDGYQIMQLTLKRLHAHLLRTPEYLTKFPFCHILYQYINDIPQQTSKYWIKIDEMLRKDYSKITKAYRTVARYCHALRGNWKNINLDGIAKTPNNMEYLDPIIGQPFQDIVPNLHYLWGLNSSILNYLLDCILDTTFKNINFRKAFQNHPALSQNTKGTAQKIVNVEPKKEYTSIIHNLDKPQIYRVKLLEKLRTHKLVYLPLAPIQQSPGILDDVGVFPMSWHVLSTNFDFPSIMTTFGNKEKPPHVIKYTTSYNVLQQKNENFHSLCDYYFDRPSTQQARSVRFLIVDSSKSVVDPTPTINIHFLFEASQAKSLFCRLFVEDSQQQGLTNVLEENVLKQVPVRIIASILKLLYELCVHIQERMDISYLSKNIIHPGNIFVQEEPLKLFYFDKPPSKEHDHIARLYTPPALVVKKAEPQFHTSYFYQLYFRQLLRDVLVKPKRRTIHIPHFNAKHLKAPLHKNDFDESLLKHKHINKRFVSESMKLYQSMGKSNINIFDSHEHLILNFFKEFV